MATSQKQKTIREILQLQISIGRSLHGFTPNVWLGLNLTIAQLKSLFFIEYEKTTNFKSLAAALGVTPPNVTGIIDRLVDQGLVKRVENPENRRMYLLSLTPKGKHLLLNLHERGEQYASTVLELLSPEELAALAQGLSGLAKAIAQHKETRG